MSQGDAQAVLDLIFGDEVSESETVFHGNKYGPIDDLIGNTRYERSRGSYYTNTSVFTPVPEVGLVRKTKHISRMFCVVLDDIGEKYPVPSLEPTLIVETSAGNFQYVYVLEDPLPRDEALVFCARMRACEGLGDRGAMKANQLIRLPLGTNGKDKDGKRGFRCALRSSGGPYYSSAALIEAWRLPNAASAAVVASAEDAARAVGMLDEVSDPVADWLWETGRVLEGGDDEFLRIRCSCDEEHGCHSDGQVWAQYSALGQGEMPTRRVFFCFHESCKDLWGTAPGEATENFLLWVTQNGGPAADRIDPVAGLIRRWVMVGGHTAVDLDATARTKIDSHPLKEFMALHSQEIRIGGRHLTWGALWKAHPELIRCPGSYYRPDMERLYEEDDGVQYLNTYRPIDWPLEEAERGSVDVYMAHVTRLLPDPAQRSVFHSWVAWKLQNPALRSYALVLVAEAFGTGRSSLGRVLGALWQTGVRKPPLDKITGSKNNSQAVFNAWMADTQLVISEETKQGIGRHEQQHDMYEALKRLVEPGETDDMEFEQKNLRAWSARVYCNFLFFTNHVDALQIPAGDRRFGVLSCTDEPLPEDMAQAISQFARSSSCLAALYHHYMRMDVSAFDPWHPPESEAKDRMITAGKGGVQQAIEDVLEDMPGDIVTQAQLLKRVEEYIARGGDPDLAKRAPSAVGMEFKKMRSIGDRFSYNNYPVRCRIVRNAQEHLTKWGGDTDYLREILSLNDDPGMRYDKAGDVGMSQVIDLAKKRR